MMKTTASAIPWLVLGTASVWMAGCIEHPPSSALAREPASGPDTSAAPTAAAAPTEGRTATTAAEPASSGDAECAAPEQLGELLVRQADHWRIVPALEFEIDDSRLRASSRERLRRVCALLTARSGRVDASVAIHPDVARAYRDRSRDLPEVRARSLASALSEDGCPPGDVEVELDESLATTGPPVVRLRPGAWRCGGET